MKELDHHSSSLEEPFNGGQHSSKNVIASDETITLDYSYYLPRRDRVYLTSDGVFTVKTGIPGDNPVLPDPIPNSMSIASISLPYISTRLLTQMYIH